MSFASVKEWQDERVANASPNHCAWCDAPDDLIEAGIGKPLKTIWICADGHACRLRWPVAARGQT